MSTAPVFETRIAGLKLLHRGKVRDVYELDAEHLLFVATDRLSAFDVVLPDPVPGKGSLLTRISNFWFERTRHLCPNHLTGIPLDRYFRDPAELAMLEGRAVVVRRLQPLPVEAVVRGYLIGSGWKDYQRTGAVCGITLPGGLRLASRLPEPIFTPATKAAVGDHDENIDFQHVEALLGKERAAAVRDLSLALYRFAAAYALERGIIIADTKFEFGLFDGELILIDEVLTPDSSRFWPADQYAPGRNPPSYDKQFVRDYLETLAWDKTPPAPALPAEVVDRTQAKYLEAFQRLTGRPL